MKQRPLQKIHKKRTKALFKDDVNYIDTYDKPFNNIYEVRFGDLYDNTYTIVYFKNRGQFVSYLNKKRKELFDKK